MNTTADKLELLLRTKERQKAYLQEKYPLLDFDTIPFRAYLDLFQGRSYVPGFVGGWKAYGRSNDEDAETRKYLTDYSGNGRDIELFNFAFSGMSGYGGYPHSRYDFRLNNDLKADILEKKFKAQCFEVKYRSKIDNLAEYALYLYNSAAQPWEVDKPQKIKAGYKGLKVIWANDRSLIAEVNEGEIATFTITQSDIDAGHTLFYFGTKEGLNVGETTTIQFLADYPGALVSDGVDDYGQCIKDFALPDDYTVVAIRKPLLTSDSCLAGKTKARDRGAFIFEYAGNASTSGAYSYGVPTTELNRPALFSWQNRTSYNDQPISVGTGTDTDEDRLTLFVKRVSSSSGGAMSAALYDLRIYDHSLTAEELQTVKDEMMSDYENATGGV